MLQKKKERKKERKKEDEDEEATAEDLLLTELSFVTLLTAIGKDHIHPLACFLMKRKRKKVNEFFFLGH